MDEKKRLYWLLLILCLILTFFSLWIASFINPWQENLTGFGWIKGHLFLMGLWNIYGCGLSLFLSYFFLYPETKLLDEECCFSWIGLALGCLIPYQEDPIAFLGDAHSLICVISFVFWLKGWMRRFYFSVPFSLTRKISQNILLWFGLCLAISYFTGGICFFSEAGFVCGFCWILYFANIKKSKLIL